MVVRENNIDKVPKHEQELLRYVLHDLKELNKLSPLEMEIHWQDWHDEYSPEQIDFRPDYYGTYTLRFKDSDEFIGLEMDLEELNRSFCLLIEYLEHVRTR